MQKPKKLPADVNARAAAIVALSTGQPLPKLDEAPKQPEKAAKPERERNPAAVALGRLGGLKGGKARAEKLTPEQRSEIGKKAASTRWAKKAAGH